MKTYRNILIIGIIEILIGGITLTGTLLSLVFSLNTKPLNVLLFILATACVSSAIGFGMLRSKQWAYHLLLYFSSVIFLSKILIFMGILQLNGALITPVPQGLNHLISMSYHGLLFWYLQQPKTKQLFQI